MNSDTDLFGDPVNAASLIGRGRSGKGKQWGYAMPPGTGPVGETCGSCAHIVRTRRFRKCSLTKAHWTHGFKTDILARAAACSRWQASLPK